MSRQSASIVIRRPPEEVYAYMDDVSREKEWQPNLQFAERDPPGPTVVGTRKRYVSRFMGREVKNTYVVTELQPGARIVYETEKGSAIDARSEVLVQPEGTDTLVTMSVDGKPRGALRLLPRSAFELAGRAELKAALERVKGRLEASR